MKQTLFLLSMLAVLLLSGCVTRMDPFEGRDGVRANINGEKYVMEGIDGRVLAYSPFKTGEGSERFEVNVLLLHLMGKKMCKLVIHLESSTPFVVGNRYPISASSAQVSTLRWITAGEISSNELNPETPADPLNGWLVFEKIEDESVEASFEFEGSSTGVAVRHGFLRLITSH